MKTSEVLYEAANLIEFRGWDQGGGWFGSGELCLEGAIFAAWGREWNGSIRDVETCPAGRAVRKYLDLAPTGTPGAPWRDQGGNLLPDAPLFSWNDAPVRTAEEVTTVLRAAAVIEAAKEQAAVDTPAVSVAPVRSGL